MLSTTHQKNDSGIIYCPPSDNDRGEFLETTQTNMEDHPDKFGFLFQKIIEVGEGSAVQESLTKFDHAIVKFGGQKEVYEVLETAMKPVNVYCKETNLCPFMIVASCAYKETITLSATNQMLRRDLSWMNNCTSNSQGKKRKHNSVLKR